MIKYFILLILFPIFSSAQEIKIISGYLFFEKLPIDGFFVQAVNEKTNNTIAFDVSNKDGAYSLKIDSKYQNIRIIITQIGFKRIDTLVTLSKDSIFISFFLIREQYDLPEVNVSAKKAITIEGDTTTYNVSALKKNEKTIEELLKKLPGIEVNTNGDIKFKNKPIKTILIDGDNIVQNDYKILSKNLTPEMVEKIQAIENYSDNELLTGVVTGNETVLNLVINKNFKGIVYNKTEGLSTIVDSLHQISNLTLSLLKNTKIINVFDNNNIGKYNRSNSFEKKDNSALDLGSSLLDNSYLNSLSDENVSKFNNSIFNNFSLFTKKKGKFEGSIHYDYFTDKQKFSYNNTTTYLNTNPSFVFSENLQSAIKARNHNIKFNTKIFTSKLSFLVCTVEYNFINSAQYKQVINTIANQQNSAFDTIKIRNYSLYYIRKLNLKNALEVELYYKEKNNPQALEITPGVYTSFFKNSYDSITQADYFTEKKSGNEIRLSGNNNWAKYVFNVGYLHKTSTLGSTINLLSPSSISTADSLQNAEKITNRNFYFSNKLDKALFYKVTLKIENKISVEDISNELFQKTKLFYNSTIFLRSKIGTYANVDFTFRKSSNFINATSYIKNYFFSKYNILVSNNVGNFATENKQEYKVDYTAINFFKNQQMVLFSISLTNNQSPITHISENLSDLSIQKSQLFTKNINNQSLVSYLLLGKMFPSIKSRANFSILFLKLKYKMLQENSSLSNLISNVVNAKLGLSSNFRGFFNYELKCSLGYNENKIFSTYSSNVFRNTTIDASLKLIANVKKRLNAQCNLEYIKNTATAFFLDANIEYSFPKNNFLIELGGHNLLNNHTLTSYFSSEYYVQKNQTVVFPRFLYLKLKYNFSFKL